MSNIFPLMPAEAKLRQDLGTHGDTGNELHAKVDRVLADTGNILTDTADIQPKLGTFITGTVAGDIADLKTTVQSLDPNNDDVIALLEDADIGLSAIKTEVSTNGASILVLDGKIGTPANATVSEDIAAIALDVTDAITAIGAIDTKLGSPSAGTVSADLAAILSAVSVISNSTRTVVPMLEEFELPPTGQTYSYYIALNNFDGDGIPNDADSLPTVSVIESAGGASRSANLVDDAGIASTTMIKDSVGRYHIRYKVTDTHAANEGLLFSFTLVEGGVTRVFDKVARTVEEISSTFTVSDRVALGNVQADTDDIQSKIGSPVTGSIAADIATVRTELSALDDKVDAIPAELSSIKDSVSEVKNKDINGTYDAATDSLEAISEKLDTMAAAAANNNTFVRAYKSSGSISSGSSELVAIEAVNGVTSPYINVKEIRVVPSTQTSTNFTVELFEDAAATLSLMKFEKANATKNDLRLAIDLVYINRDASPVSKIYVKITNVSDSSSSVFNVEVRGIALTV